MKAIVCSDLHGSVSSALALKEIVQKENADLVLMLGDFLYNGPRNGVFDDYDPEKVIDILNEFAAKIIACEGNCDARIDKELLNFKIPLVNQVVLHGRAFYLVHGDMLDKKMVELKEGNVLLYGHTHKPNIQVVDGVLLLNPGSIALPKQSNHKKTYMIINDDELRLYSIGGELLLVKSITSLFESH